MGMIHCVYTSEATTTIGPEELERILAVSRERNAAAGVTGMLRRLVVEPSGQRGFADWAMGSALVEEAEIQALAGSADLMSATATLSALGDAEARALMMAFVRGRWRARIRAGASR